MICPSESTKSTNERRDLSRLVQLKLQRNRFHLRNQHLPHQTVTQRVQGPGPVLFYFRCAEIRQDA